VRRYLLAGLITCGRCGRRLESCWSCGRPAYRCRHGYTSATAPDSARPRNTYVREDQILPHLAALAILLAGPAPKPARSSRGGRAQLTRPAGTAVLIDQLNANGTVLTYHPDDRTLRADGLDAPPCNHRHGPRRHSRAPGQRKEDRLGKTGKRSPVAAGG
jgi:site-specific DNA recombinase